MQKKGVMRACYCLLAGALLSLLGLACTASHGKKNKQELDQSLQADNSAVMGRDAEIDTIRGRLHFAFLVPDRYRNDGGQPSDYQAKGWKGLYYDSLKDQCISKEVQPQASYQYDECTADSALVISEQGGAVFFYRGLSSVAEPVPTARVDKWLFAGRSKQFSLEGKPYQLIIKADCKWDDGTLISGDQIRALAPDALMGRVKQVGFELLLQKEQGKATRFFRLDSLEYTNPSILWMGDLNKDGLPDLLIDAPVFMESSHYYFWLSDIKDPRAPLKLVDAVLVQRDC